MKIDIGYLNKNILITFFLLIVIDLIIFNSSSLAKYSLIGWSFALIPLGILIRSLFKRLNNFSSGLIGEIDIERELKSLGESFICINGFDTGKGNIDKIVLGPTGVWTLEVKSHKGNITFVNDTLLINNRPPEKDFLKQAYSEAKTLEDLFRSKLNLEIKVQPVLVFSNKFAKIRLGMKTYKGVYVVGKAWLNKLITETHNRSLNQETFLKIKNILSGENNSQI